MEMKDIFWTFTVLVAAGALLMFASGIGGASGVAQQSGGKATLSAPGTQYAAAGAQALAASPSAASPSAGNVQEITLSVQGSQYYPNPIIVKKGIPVRLVADISRMPGCSKSIVIPEFGIQKTVQNGDNVIEFTPTQSGTFSFSCSMNMYRGAIVVEEADGSVASFTGNAPAPKAATGSCGMAKSGGCGCGG